jgi:predicted P-loop ATPase/GTPase
MSQRDAFCKEFNALKADREQRLLLKYGDKRKCELVVRNLLDALSPTLEGQDVDVVFLVAGQVVAEVLKAEKY